jgi:hypothetical protein
LRGRHELSWVSAAVRGELLQRDPLGGGIARARQLCAAADGRRYAFTAQAEDEGDRFVMPMRNAAAQTLAAPARHVGRRRREQDGFPCDPKAAHRIRVSTAGPARSRVRILRSRVSHDRAALQYRSLYLLAAPSMQNRTRQRARRRPWTALAGSGGGAGASQGQKPPADKSGARGRTRGPPGNRPPIKAPSPSAFSGKA